NVSSVMLTAAAESPVATIEVDGQPLGRTGRVIALEPGAAKTVIIDVTAESGNLARTVVRLSRERVGSGRDTNARLARLQLAGAQLNPSFDPRVLEYEAKLAQNVSSVMLTAAAESPVATIEVDGQPLGRTGRVITLEPGAAKTVIVDVTAESGNLARTVVRLSRDAGDDTGGPVVKPSGYGISVTLDEVKIASRELTSISGSRGSIGKEARITVRYYRTNTVIAQGTANVATKMQGATPALSASWESPNVKLDQGKLVEIEVAIPAGGSNWLHYTEAQWSAPAVAVNVPFLWFSNNPRVVWPAVGKAVNVTGFISLPPGGPRKAERQVDSESLELNAKGDYGVEVTITDPASGKILGRDTVWAKPGLPRGQALTFTKPMSLPEGATVKYTLAAKAKNGQGWAASGTTQIWTTNLAYEGGFEPVILQFAEELVPPPR
ncbi:MAG: cadherin-like beta sandwich domain-containing protein, partial [Spirochaetes bacterium]|nr:cadherin-like beta sandwich domain-containing protein [Spirochaetota bacterium]